MNYIENNKLNENKVMKINERQLRQIIRESVKKVLKESEFDQLLKQSRTYRPNMDGQENIMNKTFNNGNGSLAFVEIIPNEKVLLVNKLIAKKRDIERIKQCFPEYTIEEVELGYPDWYFKKNLRSVRKPLKETMQPKIEWLENGTEVYVNGLYAGYIEPIGQNEGWYGRVNSSCESPTMESFGVTYDKEELQNEINEFILNNIDNVLLSCKRMQELNEK